MNSFTELQTDYLTKDKDYYSLSRPEMMPFIPQKCNKILDVGCSSGAFAAEIKRKYGCIAWGIEPNEEVAKQAATKLDHVICGIFNPDNQDLKGNKFDVIFFNDVLEHLVNPYEVLNQCKSLLNPSGCIVASIPNIQFFPVFFNQIILKGEWNYTDFGTLDKTHLRFFTKKSIIKMFEDLGYEIVRIQGINAETPRRYKILNTIFFNKLDDWKYLQFGVQARLK